MVKSIIKEIIIILLLLLAVILAVGILLYDYMPNNKIVPSVETYTTSSAVLNELQTPITENQTINVIYELTASDLTTLEKTKDYQKGKANPFADTTIPVSGNASEGNTNDNTNIAGGGSETQGNNTNNNNTFYRNPSTK